MRRSAVKAFLLALFLLTGLCGPVSGDERITDFRVTVVVGADSTLTVREEIAVTVEGKEIRRGIIRAVPTLYRTRNGKTERVAFALESATLDGRKVPASTSTTGRDTEIRLGDPDVLLTHEPHVYAIAYRISGQVSFFDSHDELFWNVTGNEWTFPIDRAEYRIVLPGDGNARITGVAWYTGREGEKGKDARRLPDGSFETTRTLAPGEGLSVAVGWPKGLVTPPPLPLRERMTPFVTRHKTAISLLFVAIFLVYYGYAWRRKGRDPTPQVIPLFRPPEGVSPGYMRFVRTGRMDITALMAEFMDLAVKKHFRFGEADGDSLTLLRGEAAPSPDALSPALRGFLSTVFPVGVDRFIIAAKSGNFALKGVQDGLEAEYRQAAAPLVKKNRTLWFAGLLLFIPMIWVLSTAESKLFRSGDGFGLFTVLIETPLGYAALLGILSAVRGMRGRGLGARLWRFLSCGVLAAVFGAALLHAFTADAVLAGGIVAACVVAGVFWRLLPARTEQGARLAADIEGLAMYIGTAETEQLEAMNPPQETPETFEAILPYAVALDLADTWAARFENILADAAYAPAWTTSGGDMPTRIHGVHDIGGRIISSAISRAVVARSSSSSGTRRTSWSGSSRSSGLGGGGRSGGGGGGGGGRGW
jgi:uncharacterized membrane protein YgcG